MSDEVAPGYSEIIARPVALRTMLARAEAAQGTARTSSGGGSSSGGGESSSNSSSSRYEGWEYARADFDLMLANCKVSLSIGRSSRAGWAVG